MTADTTRLSALEKQMAADKIKENVRLGLLVVLGAGTAGLATHGIGASFVVASASGVAFLLGFVGLAIFGAVRCCKKKALLAFPFLGAGTAALVAHSVGASFAAKAVASAGAITTVHALVAPTALVVIAASSGAGFLLGLVGLAIFGAVRYSKKKALLASPFLIAVGAGATALVAHSVGASFAAKAVASVGAITTAHALVAPTALAVIAASSGAGFLLGLVGLAIFGIVYCCKKKASEHNPEPQAEGEAGKRTTQPRVNSTFGRPFVMPCNT